MKITKTKLVEEKLREEEKIETEVKLTPEGEPATRADVIKVNNALTRTLDEALRVAREAVEDEEWHRNCNVLVTGLPGSSKTKTIEGWGRANGVKVWYLDAKNPDLVLLTSGGSTVDKSDPEHPKMKQVFSDALAPLNEGPSVLFLDELNRQLREYLRGSLLTLIDDRAVAGPGEDGKQHFPNLLFTVAAINPRVHNEKGVDDLSGAERRRFHYQCEFNSTKETATAYFTDYYNGKLRRLATEDKTKPNYKRRVAKLLRGQDIGNYLMKAIDFSFTTTADVENDNWKLSDTPLAQANLTELIENNGGDKEQIIKDLKNDNWSLGLPQDKTDMLIKLLNRYIPVPVEELRARKEKELGINLKAADEVDTEAKPEPTAVEEPEVKPTKTAEDDYLDGIDGEDDDKDFVDTEYSKSGSLSDDELDSRIDAGLDGLDSL